MSSNFFFFPHTAAQVQGHLQARPTAATSYLSSFHASSTTPCFLLLPAHVALASSHAQDPHYLALNSHKKEDKGVGDWS